MESDILKQWLSSHRQACGFSPLIDNSLPEKVKIYRGLGSKSRRDGISWTLSKEKAEWFATRFKDNGEVLTAEANKSDILAFLNGRNEQEIIINPKKLKML